MRWELRAAPLGGNFGGRFYVEVGDCLGQVFQLAVGRASHSTRPPIMPMTMTVTSRIHSSVRTPRRLAGACRFVGGHAVSLSGRLADAITMQCCNAPFVPWTPACAGSDLLRSKRLRRMEFWRRATQNCTSGAPICRLRCGNIGAADLQRRAQHGDCACRGLWNCDRFYRGPEKLGVYVRNVIVPSNFFGQALKIVQKLTPPGAVTEIRRWPRHSRSPGAARRRSPGCQTTFLSADRRCPPAPLHNSGVMSSMRTANCCGKLSGNC